MLIIVVVKTLEQLPPPTLLQHFYGIHSIRNMNINVKTNERNAPTFLRMFPNLPLPSFFIIFIFCHWLVMAVRL